RVRRLLREDPIGRGNGGEGDHDPQVVNGKIGFDARGFGPGRSPMDGRYQGDAMISNRAVTALLLIAALAVVSSPVAAQYMYLDSNGNGVHDSGDRLGLLGVP